MLGCYPFNFNQRNYCYYQETFAIDSAKTNYDSESPFLAKVEVLTTIAAEGFLIVIAGILIVVTFAFKDATSFTLTEQLSQRHYSFQDHLDRQYLVMVAAITKKVARITVKSAQIATVMYSASASFDFEDGKNCLAEHC